MKSKVTRNMTSLFLTAVMCAGMLGRPSENLP